MGSVNNELRVGTSLASWRKQPVTKRILQVTPTWYHGNDDNDINNLNIARQKLNSPRTYQTSLWHAIQRPRPKLILMHHTMIEAIAPLSEAVYMSESWRRGLACISKCINFDAMYKNLNATLDVFSMVTNSLVHTSYRLLHKACQVHNSRQKKDENYNYMKLIQKH